MKLCVGEKKKTKIVCFPVFLGLHLDSLVNLSKGKLLDSCSNLTSSPSLSHKWMLGLTHIKPQFPPQVLQITGKLKINASEI